MLRFIIFLLVVSAICASMTSCSSKVEAAPIQMTPDEPMIGGIYFRATMLEGRDHIRTWVKLSTVQEDLYRTGDKVWVDLVSHTITDDDRYATEVQLNSMVIKE